MANRRPKRLETVRQVLEFLGPAWVKKATGRREQHMSNWRSNERLPPTLYQLMTRELARRDAIAPGRLWLQEQRRPRAA